MISEENIRTDRRTVIASIAAVGSSAFAGCNGGSDAPDRNGTAGADAETETEGESGADAGTDGAGGLPGEVADAKADVESAYERLASLPVAADGEFVFDVYAFEDEFDHEEVRSLARDARERLEATDAADVSGEMVDSLIAAAELAERLTTQRVVLHQTIVAAFAYEHHLLESEYEPAIEAIGDARSSLSDLSSYVDRIEEHLDGRARSRPPVEGYDPGRIRGAQAVLAEIARWLDPAYEGLHRAIEGFRRFEAVTEALERDRFGTAGEAIETARERFAAAEDAFDRAHGRGRRLQYVAPLVDDIRCMTPAYREGCDRLRDAFEAYDDGNESRGEEIAEEALDEMDETIAPCV